MQPAAFIGPWQALPRLSHSEKAFGICVENQLAARFLRGFSLKDRLHELVGDMLGRILSDMDYRLVRHLGILRVNDGAMLTCLLGSLFCVAAQVFVSGGGRGAVRPRRWPSRQ
jgi:hypothetical protein